jgi:hypothetical protein
MKHVKLFEEFLFEDLKRADIHKLFGDPHEISLKQDAMRIKALLWIYKYQTPEEKHAQTTRVLNGVGFTGVDGELLSSFAKQIISKGYLSDRQMEIVRKKMKKYEMQMMKISNSIANGKLTKDPKIEAVMNEWLSKNMHRYKNLSQMKIQFGS